MSADSMTSEVVRENPSGRDDVVGDVDGGYLDGGGVYAEADTTTDYPDYPDYDDNPAPDSGATRGDGFEDVKYPGHGADTDSERGGGGGAAGVGSESTETGVPYGARHRAATTNPAASPASSSTAADTASHGAFARGGSGERLTDNSARNTHDYAETPQRALPGETTPVVPHLEVDRVLKEALRSGAIPEEVRLDPSDRLMVEAALAEVHHILTTQMPGMLEVSDDVVRAMPSDAEVVESLRRGVTLTNALVACRKLVLAVEDSRARLAREAAYAAIAGDTMDSIATHSDTLGRLAGRVADKVYPHSYNGQVGVEAAPFVAGYGILLAVGSHSDQPDLVAATVLGFDQACRLAGANLTSHPEEFSHLRRDIRRATLAALAQVQREFEQIARGNHTAVELGQMAAARTDELVILNCFEVARRYHTDYIGERQRAIAAQTAADQAAADQAAVAAERLQRLRVAREQAAYDYNCVVASDPSDLGADIPEAMRHGDMPGLVERVAALIEHAGIGTPGARRMMERVLPHVQPSIISYLGSLGETLMRNNRVISPALAIVAGNLDPRSMEPGLARTVYAVQGALDTRVAAHFYPNSRLVRYENSTTGQVARLEVQMNGSTIPLTPSDLAVLRGCYLYQQLNDGQALAAAQEFRNAGDDDAAATIDDIRNGRLTYLERVTRDVDLSNAPEFSPALREAIIAARQYVANGRSGRGGQGASRGSRLMRFARQIVSARSRR